MHARQGIVEYVPAQFGTGFFLVWFWSVVVQDLAERAPSGWPNLQEVAQLQTNGHFAKPFLHVVVHI
jgi:hypothetical protein